MAQTSNKIVPAEFPPASFDGRQYVDSKGCVFIRAGVDGAVSWIPRMTRGRQQVCGFQPTLSAQARQPEPAPVTASAPAPRVVASAPPPQPVRSAPPAMAPASYRSAPTPVAAPAAPTPLPKVVQEPVKSAGPCQGATPLSTQYINSTSRYPIRCGPQTAPHVTYAEGSRTYTAPAPASATTIVPGSSYVYSPGKTYVTNPGSSAGPIYYTAGQVRVAPRHVYESQLASTDGLWRASAQAQRADVIVSIGEATLVITDLQERPLAHWSLAAIERANPGKRPALYHPDGDPEETLELPEEEAEMIAAIEKLRSTIERRRPHPGRLRLVTFLAVLALVVLGGLLWLPGALRSHAVKVVPDVKRAEIGAALLRQIQRVTGPPCNTPEGRRALDLLAARVPGAKGPGFLAVMRDGVTDTVHLPGGTVLISNHLVEDHDEPGVVAGYVMAERLRAEMGDPLAELLAESPVWAAFRLLTTGEIAEDTLAAYSEALLTTPPRPLDTEMLLVGFRAYELSATPYAYALDPTGERTFELIEADPYRSEAPPPVLDDADWLRLQAICGG
ncbi:MAG: hypothetical protein RIG84_06760 [Roseovarius sp.]